MDRSTLTVLIHRKARVGHLPAIEWILAKRAETGIRGGRVTRSATDLEPDDFHPLAACVTHSRVIAAVTVEASDWHIDRFLQLLEGGALALSYIRTRSEHGVVGHLLGSQFL